MRKYKQKNCNKNVNKKMQSANCLLPADGRTSSWVLIGPIFVQTNFFTPVFFKFDFITIFWVLFLFLSPFYKSQLLSEQLLRKSSSEWPRTLDTSWYALWNLCAKAKLVCKSCSHWVQLTGKQNILLSMVNQQQLFEESWQCSICKG